MNKTDEPQKWITFWICLWLCILIAGYMALHTLYTFVSLSTPSILYFLPGAIYIIGGLLLGEGCIKRLRLRKRSAFVGLALSAVLLIVGAIFGVISLQHLLLSKG